MPTRLIWVVACRPYPEKVIGGKIEIDDWGDQTDGTYFLDKSSADNVAIKLNQRDGQNIWEVYSALITIQKSGI